MLKKLLLIIIVIFLASCNWNYEENINKNIDSINKKSIIKIQEEKNKNKERKITAFDTELIKIVLWKKDISICKQAQNIVLCKDIVNKELENYFKNNCNELTYLKEECLDNLAYTKLQCENIKDEILKRKCNLDKKYEKALKENNKSFCMKLPRVRRDKCFKKMK